MKLWLWNDQIVLFVHLINKHIYSLGDGGVCGVGGLLNIELVLNVVLVTCWL